jgi:hypothetical protein
MTRFVSALRFMPLLGAVIIRPILFVLFYFAYGWGIYFHDVHDAVIIYQLTEALEVAEELLLLLIFTRLVDVANQNQGARVERRFAVLARNRCFTDTAFVLIHQIIRSA